MDGREQFGKFEGDLYFFAVEAGVIPDYLIKRLSLGKVVEDDVDRNPRSPENGEAVHDIRVAGNMPCDNIALLGCSLDVACFYHFQCVHKLKYNRHGFVFNG